MFYKVPLLLGTLFAVTPAGKAASLISAQVSHLALDEANGLAIAFSKDGMELGRYPVNVNAVSAPPPPKAGPCSRLTPTGVQSLPGWAKLQEYARTNFGAGAYELVTNPPQYTNQPATSCVNQGAVKVTTQASPTCKTESIAAGKTTVASAQVVKFPYDGGQTSSALLTITKPAAQAIGAHTSASFGVPILPSGILPLTRTVLGQFINQQGQSVNLTSNRLAHRSVSVNAKAGQTCTLTLNVQDCQQKATTQVEYHATGFAWFNYHSLTNGHYKWAVNLERVLTVEERTSATSFEGTVAGHVTHNFTTACN